MSHEDIVDLARQLAADDYVATDTTLRPPFADLNYDRYRGIRARTRPLGGENGRFAVDLLPPGFLYNEMVGVAIIGDDGVRPFEFSADMFGFDPELFETPVEIAADGGGMGFSGFRLRFPINRPDVMDEFVVFQGASYFRAIGRDLIYGLSARGLAISTANPNGEEFPIFRRFWIEQPKPGAQSVIVRALLDSPSCAGAYEFEIAPGEATQMTTRCTIFPRETVSDIGVAPLTSMYFFGPESRVGVDDFRNAVHDSSGLQMITGGGRRLWRALSNPTALQVSAFVDENLKGFGLVQRNRDFDYYQDAEARYDRRPSAWVEPLGEWGPGAVLLVEIPTNDEFNDNVVTFWRPREPLEPSEAGHEFNYRLIWAAVPPDSAPIARVAATRSGQSLHDPDLRVVVVDFRKEQAWSEGVKPTAWSGRTEILNLYHRMLPDSDIMRVSFEFEPGGESEIEFQLSLESESDPESEIWMYRWSPA